MYIRESKGECYKIRAFKSPGLGAQKRLLLCLLFTHLGTLSSFLSPLVSRCLSAVALAGEVRFGQCAGISGG